MAKKSFLLFLSCTIVLAISPSLYAQQKPAAQPEYNNYLVVKGGIFYPRGDLDDLKVGFNGELAYGYRFHRNAAVEFASGYFGTSDTNRTVISGVAASTKAEVHAIPVTVAIKGILPINKQFDVYGLAGGGAGFSETSIRMQ